MGRDEFPNECFKGFTSRVLNDAGNDIAFAFDRADDRCLEGVATAAASAALIPMAVFVFSADVGFVHLDDAAELVDIFHQSGSDFVTHRPRGFIGTKAHVAMNLQCAHAFFAGQHEVDDFEPHPQRLVGVLKDRASNDGEPIAVRRTSPALPMEGLVGRRIVKLEIAATRAVDAIWPAPSLQIGFAGFFVREHDLELGFRKLVDRLWTLATYAGHRTLPLSKVEGYCHGLASFVKSRIIAFVKILRTVA